MKKVLITGVSSGLGKHLTKEFMHNNYTVWGVGRRSIEEIELNCNLPDEKFHYSVCDVSNQDDIKAVYTKMIERDFIPDIVILNAATLENDISQDFNYRLFRKAYETNLFGAIKWVELFLPHFLVKRKGIFVAISSLSTYRAMNINKIGYPSSKAALNMAFESFRLQYASNGVRFITFCPGRMIERNNSPLKITYAKAAKIIFGHLHNNKKRNIIDFPLLSSLIFKISRYAPDYLVSIIRLRKE